MTYNVSLEALAHCSLDRIEKAAVVPMDGQGAIPPGVDPATMGMGMDPAAMGVGMDPAAMGMGMDPAAMGMGSMPGAPTIDLGQQLTALNSKIDTLIGTLQGYMAASANMGSAGGSGSGRGGNAQMMQLLQQIASSLGVGAGATQSPPNLLAGMMGGNGVGAAPGGGGMTVSASAASNVKQRAMRAIGAKS